VVRTIRPDGDDLQYLGSLGSVLGLQYSFSTPGGADQMSATLQIPPSGSRPAAIDPGRTVEILRGGSIVWSGRLNEGQPSASGWALSAHGLGGMATDFDAVYTPLSAAGWTLNGPVDAAIARGLPWVNPGITAGWLSQQVDSGSQKISDHLNGIAGPSGQTWEVDNWSALRMFPLPAVVNRLVLSTGPIARTISRDLTTLFLKYAQSDDGQGNVVYGLTDAFNQQAIDERGATEDYQDLSNAGVMSASAAQAVGNTELARYQRVAWAGPITVRQGQILTTGGTAVDLGCERSGTVDRVLVTGQPFGGEASAGLVQFVRGQYEYYSDSDTAQITPMQSARADLSSLLSLIAPRA